MRNRINKTYRQRFRDDFLVGLASLLIGLGIGIYATFAIILYWA